MRELAVAYYGSELVYLLGLAVLLGGTAAGTLAGQWLPGAARREPPRALFLVFAVLLPAALAVARGLHHLLGGTPGAFLSFGQQLAGLALALLPLGLAGGLLFQRAAAASVDAGGRLAGAYAVESAGGLVGGAATTALLALGLSNLSTAIVGASVAALGAARRSHGRSGAPRAVGFAMAALALGALAFARALDRATTRWNHPGLVATVDTPYGRATVTRAGGQLAVFQNGALAWESEGTAAEELVQVAALAVEMPRRVLLVGGAVAGLVPEVLAHHPERVDLLELDRRLLATVRPLLPERSRAALEAPTVHLAFAEPRRVLARDVSYDLVLVGQPEPDSGQSNRFYTREFFALVARRLAPGGVLALRLSGAENLWTPALARRATSVARALEAVFPSVVVLPGTTNVMLASASPLVLDPETLAARLAARGIQTRLVTPPYLRYLLTNDRRAEIAARLAATSAPENRDARPICYQLTLLLWLSRFFPAFGRFEPPGWLESAALVPALAAGSVLLVALAAGIARRRPALRRTLLVAAAGAFGMVFEGVVILAFQVRRGVLFQDLGVLLTMFMAGLAVGSAWVDRRAAGGGATRTLGAGILLAASATALATAALVAAGVDLGLVGAAALLLAAGAATGALFGWASLAGVSDAGSVVAPLYAADLMGGSLGALAGTLLLLPLLGLSLTALLLGVGATALLLLVRRAAAQAATSL